MKSITCDFCGTESNDSTGWVLSTKDLCPSCVPELRAALGMATGVLASPQATPQRPASERNPLLETDFGQGVKDNGGAIGRNFLAELGQLRIVNEEKRRKL